MLEWPGHEPVRVAFDTGTSGNALDIQFWRTTRLQRTGDALVTDGGTGLPIEAFETRIPNAKFSGYPVGDLVASVYGYRPRDEVGIVGPNMFWDQLVYLEFEMGRLRVRKLTQEAIPDWPAYPYHDFGVPNSTPALTVQLPNGESVLGTLDSGANAQLLLPMRFKERLALSDHGSGRQISAGSVSEVSKAKLGGVVRVGPVTLNDPDVVFFPGEFASAGMPILNRLRVLLDPAGHRWWALTPRILDPEAAGRFTGQFGPLTVASAGQGLTARGDGQTHTLTWLGACLFISDRGDRWNDAFGSARTLFDFHGQEKATALEAVRTSGSIEVFARS
ncbi:MAG TPA: hypothetical protein VG942_00705 [Hyphomonadaceae bacterium]|nr:hypothetical protein [Hyphomonadaceae bacterium]